MHGKTSPMHHDAKGCLPGWIIPVTVCAITLFVVEETSLPDCLEATAHTDQG